jgi:hypothetical protein
MKNNWLGTLLAFCMLPVHHHGENKNIFPGKIAPVEHLFIITIDGCRWQEIFNGADPAILHDEVYTPDTNTVSLLYDSPSTQERRKKLMPFFWNVIAEKGILAGNRNYGNKVNVANPYAISYPGYNEIFTGISDESVSSNDKENNPHTNVLEYLYGLPGFRDSIAAFTSWNVFPFILNRERNHLTMNSGYENLPAENDEASLFDKVQERMEGERTGTRHDELTFLAASDYLQTHHPRILYLGLGETDEYAHRGRYDLYLDKMHESDRMIGELWHWAQTTPGYKDHTSFLITTDHGRGSKPGKWITHGSFVKGSSQTWLAAIGPNITAEGELKDHNQVYARQFAVTIAALLGEEFTAYK